VEFNLGEKIRRYRVERNLNLTDLARSTGFSKALISRIEHNLVSPPIATLYRISQALNVRMKDFFEEEPLREDIWMVRAGERVHASRDGTRYGYAYESLAANPARDGFEPLLVTLTPEHRERVHFFTHPGWEFILVISGRMLLHYGKREFLLSPGDSVFFSARVSHSGVCAGKRPVTALSIRYSGPAEPAKSTLPGVSL
jgi:transcriptional regulator with XRE-family HTH domain